MQTEYILQFKYISNINKEVILKMKSNLRNGKVTISRLREPVNAKLQIYELVINRLLSYAY